MSIPIAPYQSIGKIIDLNYFKGFEILMHFSNSFVLDFKGIQLNLIEINSVKFHEFLNLCMKNPKFEK